MRGTKRVYNSPPPTPGVLLPTVTTAFYPSSQPAPASSPPAPAAAPPPTLEPHLPIPSTAVDGVATSLPQLPATKDPFPIPVYVPSRRCRDMDLKDPSPAPITIRLVQDPPLAPSMPMIPLPAPVGRKSDEFYKYWDRFTRAKEKEKGKKKIGKKGGMQEGHKRKEGGIQRVGPSLDRDVEGRPGHPMVRSNTEGVVSRYVTPLAINWNIACSLSHLKKAPIAVVIIIQC